MLTLLRSKYSSNVYLCCFNKQEYQQAFRTTHSSVTTIGWLWKSSSKIKKRILWNSTEFTIKSIIYFLLVVNVSCTSFILKTIISLDIHTYAFFFRKPMHTTEPRIRNFNKLPSRFLCKLKFNNWGSNFPSKDWSYFFFFFSLYYRYVRTVS